MEEELAVGHNNRTGLRATGAEGEKGRRQGEGEKWGEKP